MPAILTNPVSQTREAPEEEQEREFESEQAVAEVSKLKEVLTCHTGRGLRIIRFVFQGAADNRVPCSIRSSKVGLERRLANQKSGSRSFVLEWKLLVEEI